METHTELHQVGATSPEGPNLATTPGLILNVDSISAAESPRWRIISTFLTVATSKNSLPWLPALPTFSSSCFACFSMRRRASSTPSVVLPNAGANRGFEKVFAEGYSCENCDTVEEGE